MLIKVTFSSTQAIGIGLQRLIEGLRIMTLEEADMGYLTYHVRLCLEIIRAQLN
jgi:hypothetical protein